MSNHDPVTLSGMLLDESVTFTLADLCRTCAMSAETLIALVEEGVIEPQGREPLEWRFSATSLRRARIAIRLQRDLQVNLAGAALAVDLLEELQELRARLRALQALYQK